MWWRVLQRRGRPHSPRPELRRGRRRPRRARRPAPSPRSGRSACTPLTRQGRPDGQKLDRDHVAQRRLERQFLPPQHRSGTQPHRGGRRGAGTRSVRRQLGPLSQSQPGEYAVGGAATSSTTTAHHTGHAVAHLAGRAGVGPTLGEHQRGQPGACRPAHPLGARRQRQPCRHHQYRDGSGGGGGRARGRDDDTPSTAPGRPLAGRPARAGRQQPGPRVRRPPTPRRRVARPSRPQHATPRAVPMGVQPERPHMIAPPSAPGRPHRYALPAAEPAHSRSSPVRRNPPRHRPASVVASATVPRFRGVLRRPGSARDSAHTPRWPSARDYGRPVGGRSPANPSVPTVSGRPETQRTNGFRDPRKPVQIKSFPTPQTLVWKSFPAPNGCATSSGDTAGS